MARANLLAYDITTGNLITSFNHRLNGQGRAITASPDGARMYVAGDSPPSTARPTTGSRPSHTATGALNTNFSGSLNASARTVTASNTAVYVGGKFTTANGSSAGPAGRLLHRRGLLRLEPRSRDARSMP